MITVSHKISTACSLTVQVRTVMTYLSLLQNCKKQTSVKEIPVFDPSAQVKQLALLRLATVPPTLVAVDHQT